MAKDPCKYKLPGSDTWMSELEFKQALSDGLLDQLMIESGLSVPSLKGFSPDSNKAESYKLGRGKGQKMTEDTGLKSSGFDPNDNLFSKPELAKNTNFGWRTMGTDEFNSLASGEKKYEGGAPEGGNWISGVPESSAKFGGEGKVMVEFGGIDIKGGENMSAGSTADRNNVTKVWKYNSDTQKFEEAPELLDAIKNGSKLEATSEKTNDNKIAELQNQIDEIFDKSIPALEEKLKKTKDEYGLFADGYSLEGINKQRELYKSNDVDIDELLTDEQKSIIGEMQSLQDKSDELENQISDLDEEEGTTKSYEDLANKIRNIKIDTRGTAMSSLPGLVEAWNLAVEAAAKAVEVAGATADALQKGIAAAEKAFKESDFYKSLKDRDERLRYMNDLRNGIQQTLEEKKPTGKQKKAGKEFKGQVEEVTGVKPNRETVTLTEAEALKIRIRAEVAAAKDAAKAIDKIKQDVIDFAKGALPKESYSQKELNRVLAAVRKAKDEKSLNKALDSISGLVEKKNEQIRKKKISDIRKKIKDKKTLYTKVDGKWRGKVTVEAQEEFNEFIGELSDLEAMSMEELTEVEEIINGIVENGRADFNRLKAIQEERKKREAADMLEELAGKPSAILSDNDAISEFFDGPDAGYVIIDGKMYNKSSYRSSPYNNKANPQEINGPIKAYKKVNLSEKKKILEDKKTKFGTAKEWIKKASVMDNIYGFLQKIGKGKPKTTKFINENIVTPIKDYFIDSQVSFKERMDSYRDGIKNIFGSEKAARKRLNENASINPLRESRAQGVGVSNSRLVSLYNMSRLENGMERLEKSGVDSQDLVDYIESNQDLLDYANFLVDQYNEMKAEYEPTYISVTGMPFPEGYYYPAYTDVNFDDDVLSESDILDPDGNFSALNAMTNNLKQRTNYKGAFNTALGAEEVFIDYVKNMERAKYLIPVARAANQLFAQQNRPYLIENLTPRELNDLQKHLAIIFTGKRQPKQTGEDVIDTFMNFNTVATLGLKLKSIPSQMSSFTNFWGEGIKHGINPLKVIAAFPTNADERQFLLEIATSEYLKERREGKALDLEVKRILNIKNKTAFQRSWSNFVSKAMFFPGMADYLVNISPLGGGGSYAIANLRNELAKGLSLEEAKKVAFRNYVEGVEETQQTSQEDYTSGFQRSTIGRMLSAYKSSQIGFARKIVKGYRTLGDSNASDAQKAQAYYDMIYYTIFSSILFSLVSNAGWKVLISPDDEEFNEDLRVGYDIGMDQTQSVAQGFGVTGFLIDALINATRQDEWKMNVPLIDFLFDAARSGGAIIEAMTKDDLTDPKMSEEERMRFFEETGISSEYYNNEDVEKVLQLYKEASIWQKMTPQQRKKFLKTAGIKNVVEQAKDFYEYSKGEQEFIDAFMNYEKDYFESAKARQKTDFIFKIFFGEDYIPKKRPESAEPEYVGEEMKENVDKGLKLEEINN